MSLLHRTYSGTPRTPLSRSTTDLTYGRAPVSKLVILQARFQQKQLKEKEERLLKLYEEQQERTMQRVGSRAQSGGSSVSSTGSVGAGKVRTLFQSRRGTSEPRPVAPAGRDRSRPLEPLPKQPPARTQSFNHSKSPWTRRHNSDLQLNDETFHPYLNELETYDDNRYRRNTKQKPTVPYFGGSHSELRFSDELDFGQSFHVIDDQQVTDEDNYFVKSFNNKRQFYEKKFGVSEERLNQIGISNKLPNVGLSNSFSMNSKTDKVNPGKYKTYVSGSSSKSTVIHNGASYPARNALPMKRTTPTPPRSDPPSAGSVRSLTSPTNSPKTSANGLVRKTTPIPSSMTSANLPRQVRKPLTQVILEAPSEVAPPVPASRTTIPRPNPTTPPKMPPSRPSVQSSGKRSASSKSSEVQSRLLPQQDLVNCSICGRHFASDRIQTHQKICQKSTTTKRKVFDPVKQRVKGTEAEKYVKKIGKASTAKATSTRPGLQTNWRKKHEEFINSIRAAKEVQNHLKRGGKLSDLPPPPPSDYSDYVQCPHCKRKFNSGAAERHIPKCATMLHNKPNPNLIKKKSAQVPFRQK